LIHLLCCWLVLRIALGEGLAPWASLAGAALFAVHPVHVESVAWISGRTDLICSAFVLAAFVTHRRADKSEKPARWRWRGFSLLLFAAALFSKEMAATLPLLIGIDRWLGSTERRGARLRASLTPMVPYLIVFAVYMLVRHQVLGTGAEPLFRLSPIAAVATALFVLARYATLLILPIGLDAHYPYAPLQTPFTATVLISAALLEVVAWSAWRLRTHHPRASFWIVWVFVTLLPVMAFGAFGDILMADRFLYLPSAGLALLLARGLTLAPTTGRFWTRRSVLAAASTCLVLGLAIPCGLRSKLWRDDLSLFARMAETSPNSAMVRCNLGLAYYNHGEQQRAIEEFQTAIRLVPTYALAYNNIAVALERQGRLKDAYGAYRKALSLAPGQLESRINLGSLLVRLGKPEQGLRSLREIVEKYPSYAEAMYAYAEALYRSGDHAKARPWLERALGLDPFYPNTHYMLGKIAFERGDRAEAAMRMQRFLDLWHEPGIYSDAARWVITLAEAGGANPSPALGKGAGALPEEGGPSVVSQ
jgi:Tfp pilus assembly protein PilF